MAKNSNKFDLNKGSGKKFDLNKGKVNKFDLSKDNENEFDLNEEETKIIAQPNETSVASNNTTPTSEPQKKESKETAVASNNTTSTPQPKKKASNKNSAASNYTTSNSQPKKSKWMYIIGALILVALLIWGVSKCSETGPVEPEITTDPVPETVATPSDEPSTTTPNVEETSEMTTPENDEVIDSTEDIATSTTTPTTTPTPAVSEGTTEPSTSIQEETPTVARPTEIHNAPVTSATIEQKALQVIRGDFGNGQTRRNNLGVEYDAIQQHVNELYRKGLVD